MGVLYPQGAADLVGPYQIDFLELTADSNAHLVVRDGTLDLTNSRIGKPPIEPGGPAGPAILELQNATLTGLIRLGSGSACEFIMGEGSAVDGELNIGPGDSTIRLRSGLTIGENFSGEFNDDVRFVVETGVLTLEADLRTPSEGDQVLVLPDGRISVDGDIVQVQWPLINEGTIEVRNNGLFLPPDRFFGSGTVALDGGRVTFAGEINGDPTVTGPGIFAFANTFSIGEVSVGDGVEMRPGVFPGLDIAVVGDATLAQTLDGTTARCRWRVADGADLLVDRPLTMRGAEDDTLALEPGGRLVCAAPDGSGGLTLDVGFDTTNNGTIIARNGGSIRFTGTYAGDGDLILDGGAFSFEIQNPLSRPLAVPGAGGFSFSGISGGGITVEDASLGFVNASLGDEVVINGDATVERGINIGNGPITMRVTTGNSLTIIGSGFLGGDAASESLLVIDDGALLRIDRPGLAGIAWPIHNRGTLDLNGRALQLFDAAGFAPGAESTVVGPGTILVPDLAPVQFSGALVAPAGELLIRSDLSESTASASTTCTIGDAPGTIVFEGFYQPGGAIGLGLEPGFTPDPAASFVIIEADLVTGFFGDYFANAVPAPGSDTAIGVTTDRLMFDLTYGPGEITASNLVVLPASCNPADLAVPRGTLDLADITTFVSAFTAGDPIADLAEPFGSFDLADITTFVAAFTAGCP